MHEFSFRKDILPLKDKLFRLALRITQSRPEAEDVVQETMIRVWNKQEDWSRFESVEAFCLTVARNMAIDRSRMKEAQHLELDIELQETPDEANTPLENMVHEEQIALVHKLVSRLAEKQRSIMLLRDVEGKSYKEIAEILNLTEAQVKVELFRGRQRIRQQFIEIDRYGL